MRRAGEAGDEISIKWEHRVSSYQSVLFSVMDNFNLANVIKAERTWIHLDLLQYQEILLVFL